MKNQSRCWSRWLLCSHGKKKKSDELHAQSGTVYAWIRSFLNHFSKEIVSFKSNQAIKLTACPKSVKEDRRANAHTIHYACLKILKARCIFVLNTLDQNQFVIVHTSSSPTFSLFHRSPQRKASVTGNKKWLALRINVENASILSEKALISFSKNVKLLKKIIHPPLQMRYVKHIIDYQGTLLQSM